MSHRIRLSRGHRTGLVGFMALLCLAAVQPAHADLVFLKDGFVIQGQVMREGTNEFDREAREMIFIPKGFFFIDDAPRRIFFSPSLVRIAEKKPVGDLVPAYNPKQIAILKAADMPRVDAILETGDWNDKWERSITFRCYKGDVSVNQRLIFMNPYYARMGATQRLKWVPCYLTSELGPEAVRGLLSNHAAFKETKDLKPSEKAARRFKYCDFFVQAGWYDEAERALDRMLEDMPNEKARIEATQTAIKRIRNRERFDDMKRRHLAGQFETVRKRLMDFPEADASDKTKGEVAELRSEYDGAKEKMAQALNYLNTLPMQVNDGNRQAFLDISREIKAELSPEGLPRLETFLSQAAQAERQRKKGQTSLSPSELLSLAVTGWLLGSPSAEGRPERALQLWAARSLVIDTQKEPSLQKRQTLFSNYMGRKDPVPLDEVVQMIPHLPPPEPEPKLDTKPVEVRAGQGARAPSYVLQLPPEYRHSRSYPVLIVLHREGEKAQTMLERWEEAAAQNGYILAAPRWQTGAFNTAYGFSEAEHATVLYTLRDLRRRFNIDSDRVFLFGLGEGANMAMDVGLSHPDLFAGVIPMACNPQYFTQTYWRNGQYLPFYIVSGSHGGENEKRIRILMENWAIHRQYPMLWVQYKGRGVEWFGGEVPNIMDWMRAKRRAFPLHQAGSAGLGLALDGNEYCTLREGDNRYYWLSAAGVKRDCTLATWNNRLEPSKMSAFINPQSNEIFVTAWGLKNVAVHLGRNSRGENMIDFERPVTVRVNNMGRWSNQKVPPSLATLLEELYQTGDRQRLCLAKLEFPIR